MRKQIRIFLFTVLEIAALFLFVSQSMAQKPYMTTKSQDCGQNYGAPKGRVGLHRMADPEGGWQTKGFIIDSFGPMPQTAYDPNYGCYPGNARTIQRYPAFHGYYYDRPYNYRHYSEFPWNAEPNEPISYQERMNQMEPPMDQPMEPSMAPSSIMENIPTYIPSSVSMPEASTQPTLAPAGAELEEPVPNTQLGDPLLEGLM